MLYRDLGKQESTLKSPRNQQAVVADFDLFGADSKRRREQGDFNLEIIQLVETHSRETGIVQRRSGRATYDAIAKRCIRFHNTNAAAQTLGDVKTDEHAKLLRKDSVHGNVCQNLAA